MKLVQISVLILMLSMATSCQSKNKENRTIDAKEINKEMAKLTSQDLSGYETAYFASGCFWCVEAIFESVKGVEEVISGYSGGTEENPTYEQVGGGLTSHAAIVCREYGIPSVTGTGLATQIIKTGDIVKVDGDTGEVIIVEKAG